MPKRPRGKSAASLKKKAQEIQATEKNLTNSGWNALGSDVEDPELDDDNDDDDEHHQDDSDQEQDYENRPRKFRIQGEDEIERLPVKTSSGMVQRVVDKQKKSVHKDEEEDNDEEENEQDGEDQENSDEEEDSDEEEELDRTTEKERINQAKERIAELAELLSEDPEENYGKLREIRDFVYKSKLFKIKRLAILALIPIFKDLIPAYRISPLTEAQQKEKVSKDVKKLRGFEQSLLGNYREYIDILQKYVKKGRGTDPGSVRYILATSSITAACELLEAVPHFNFQKDLVEIIVGKVSSKRIDKPYERCVSTIEHVFKEDYEGQISFEVVRQLSKMIKARRYKVDPILIGTFLNLRLLTELELKADLERVDKRADDQPKLKKKNRQVLSKKERKNRKERKAIEEEVRRAETVVSTEERERLQGQTLKLVFILFFNVLKEKSAPLMGITLEGLAKFAHLVNAELFGDLLEVLRELIVERQKRLVDGSFQFKESATREALLCVVTAFALLSGQGNGESMNLDLSFFINHFYSALHALALNPDIEFSHKTLRLDDPLDPDAVSKRAKVNISTETEMMVRSFESIFFKQKGVNIGKLRTESFAKRLATSMLHMPEKSTIASLRVLDKMNKKYTAMPAMYFTDDRITNGKYLAHVEEPEQSNPEAATIWETLLLEKHYDPKIQQAAKSVLRGVGNSKV